MNLAIDQEAKKITENILSDYKDEKFINLYNDRPQPDVNTVEDILKKLIAIVFPGFNKDKYYHMYNVESQINAMIEDVVYLLERQIMIALRHRSGEEKSDAELKEETRNIILDFLRKIPTIREYVETDVEAGFEGDPAAYNRSEIILSYPGLFAIATTRIAHELYLLNVPLIPRMMTEYAHSKTGIDIHPGATLGKYFFIDHGTGIVVGETSIIGEHVKIYQGVTIGALSTRAGQKLSGVRRHPTIEDNVTIYAGATILGGNTVIGENSVIGGNVFITDSVPANTRVNVKMQELEFRGRSGQSKPRDLENGDAWFYII